MKKIKRLFKKIRRSGYFSNFVHIHFFAKDPYLGTFFNEFRMLFIFDNNNYHKKTKIFQNIVHLFWPFGTKLNTLNVGLDD